MSQCNEVMNREHKTEQNEWYRKSIVEISYDFLRSCDYR